MLKRKNSSQKIIILLIILLIIIANFASYCFIRNLLLLENNKSFNIKVLFPKSYSQNYIKYIKNIRYQNLAKYYNSFIRNGKNYTYCDI